MEGGALRDGAALEDAEALNGPDGVGEVARPLESAGDAAADTGVSAAVGDADTDTADGLGLAWFASGRSAIVPVDEAATTAAASATRPAMATIGTSATRLARGNGSRQLGQKPETGVVT